ncbi:MAG: FecR family protein [Elusimicrobiota bacterium]
MKIRIMILTGIFFVLTASAFAAEIKVVSVKGIVDVRPFTENSWKSLEKDDLLHAKDTVRTGPASMTKLECENGAKVDISENTEIILTKLTDDEKGMNLMVGKVKAFVKKLRPKEKFEVETPVTVCSVRGTSFTVEVFKNKTSFVYVHSGIVATRRLDGIGEDILVHPNESIKYELGLPPIRKESYYGKMGMETRAEVEQEMRVDMSKEQIQSAAANEMKVAEYQLGKTMVDAFGKRVRLDEYIIRPDDDEFKFVALNERDNRFDWFEYKAEFNSTLPTDLINIKDSFYDTSKVSIADGKTYFITDYKKTRSNTSDSIVDWATGGLPNAGGDVIFGVYKYKINDTELITKTVTDRNNKKYNYTGMAVLL